MDNMCIRSSLMDSNLVLDYRQDEMETCFADLV